MRISSEAVTLPSGEWHRLAFSYDGHGIARLFKDGELLVQKELKDRAGVAPSPYPLALGNRAAARYFPLVGEISQVRFYQGLPAEFGARPQLSFRSGRTVFHHLEENAQASLLVTNDAEAPMVDAKVQVVVNDEILEYSINYLNINDKHIISVPIETNLRAGTYPLAAKLSGVLGDQPVTVELKSSYDVVPRENDFMPALMWAYDPGIVEKMDEMGFTHNLNIYFAHCTEVWNSEKALEPNTLKDIVRQCDTANDYLRRGLHLTLVVGPGRWIVQMKLHKERLEFARVNRGGTPVPGAGADVTHPAIQEFASNVGRTIAQTYLQFPNVDSALIHSECRDSTALSFHPWEVAAAEKALGEPIPAAAQAKDGVPYQTIQDFPASRMIPDDDVLLRFYTWFWKDGDGWNPLHTRVHKGLKSSGRKDFWTFFDPAVRVPSLWGSGGQVDVVENWTYCYPDPIKVGQACDELFAMAAGHPGQQVMKMIQCIWYRSQTAPTEKMPKDEAKRTAWERKEPEAKVITIAPDCLEEAFWCMISRPVAGVMFHGWGALFPANHWYRMTNEQAAPRLAKLLHGVLKPLGPTLLKVPDVPARIAILESFASQMYAQCGTNGWSNSWEADVHLMLQWAGYQPKVVYDETIRRDGLEGIEVLVMPNCPVLTQSVVDEIHRFQAKGGLVVADERCCPAILPDLLAPAFKRTGKAERDKAALQKRAAALRVELEPFFTRDFRTSSLDIVGRLRRFGDANYLFLLNDKRTFGAYVGQYGLVMEKGLEHSGTAWLPGEGHIYDLVNHCEVPARPADGGMEFDVGFGPGEGKLLMQLPHALTKVAITAPSSVARGSTAEVTFQVHAEDGTLPNAVIPMKISILDAEGKEAEFSGFHAAVKGEVTLRLEPAPNETPGTWQITAEELASGHTAKVTIHLK